MPHDLWGWEIPAQLVDVFGVEQSVIKIFILSPQTEVCEEIHLACGVVLMRRLLISVAEFAPRLFCYAMMVHYEIYLSCIVIILFFNSTLSFRMLNNSNLKFAHCLNTGTTVNFAIILCTFFGGGLFVLCIAHWESWHWNRN